MEIYELVSLLSRYQATRKVISVAQGGTNSNCNWQIFHIIFENHSTVRIVSIEELCRGIPILLESLACRKFDIVSYFDYANVFYANYIQCNLYQKP